jgi:hypothetical protein
MTKHSAIAWESYRSGLWRNAEHTSRGVDLDGQEHDTRRAEAVELVEDLAETLPCLDDAARGDILGHLLALMRSFAPDELSGAMANLSDAARQALWTMNGRTGGPVGGIQQPSPEEPAVDPDATQPAIPGAEPNGGDAEAGQGDDPISDAVKSTRKRLRQRD